MKKDLWDRVEALERDLKLLRLLRLEAEKYLRQQPDPTTKGLGILIGTIEAVVSHIETLPKEQVEALDSIGCDLEIEYALAVNEQREFKEKEKRSVHEAIDALFDLLDEQIPYLESELYTLWEQIGQGSGL